MSRYMYKITQNVHSLQKTASQDRRGFVISLMKIHGQLVSHPKLLILNRHSLEKSDNGK